MKIHKNTLYRVAKIIRKLEKRQSANQQPMLSNKRRFILSFHGEQYVKYCVIGRIFRSVGIQDIPTTLENIYGFIRYVSTVGNIKKFDNEYFEIVNEGNLIVLKNNSFKLVIEK